MLQRDSFRKPNNPLETNEASARAGVKPSFPEEICVPCPACKETLFANEVDDNAGVCPKCGHHFRLSARQRIDMMIDEGTFEEHFGGMRSTDIIGFPGYEGKLEKAMADSGEQEAVVCGTGTIGGHPTAVFAMEPYFMMGSMGTVVGEKITRTFELATERGLPVVGFTVSGGARMQEGILSLMQMAKTSGAVKRHSDAGNFYVTVLTDPTTGGVTASFAMEGDVIISEPQALIGFAGPRVIEQTIRQTLPEGFQRAEMLLEQGFVDDVVERRDLKAYLTRLLSLHEKGA
jgi:acetyl-CoA carboxylase carboxyl transferase subunit beta